MRFFLEIAFKGTNYNGWQVQPNGIGVQQKMDEALQTILREDIHCIGCGRTDAGVHASQFYLHFDSEKDFPKDFLLRMNQFLPADIAVKKVIPVAENAHTRFDATLRKYVYHMSRKKDPFTKDFYVQRPYHELDFKLMKDACNILKKYTDFKSFCKSQQGSKTTIVQIKECYWKEVKNADGEIDWQFHISADRFLRGMVRLIVGAMIQIGKHKMTLEEFDAGIKKGERFKYALSAPAHGLFLTEVHYPYIERDQEK